MIARRVSLRDKNTFGFDIEANLYTEIADTEKLFAIWKTNLLQMSSPLVLGGGSNILFTKNYPGLILKNEMKGRSVISENGNEITVSIAGGDIWHETVLWAVSQGFGGIENLSLIPGSMGAAPIQNIGAYGVELEQVFSKLEAFDFIEGKLVEFDHKSCKFGYRDSIFKQEGKGRFFITKAELKLHKNSKPNTTYGDIQKTLDEMQVKNPGIADVSNAVIRIRRAKLPDPVEIGNCGSFFKNPVVDQHIFDSISKNHSDIKSYPVNENRVKIPAAWLIEKCGWKGFRRGDAGVHERQALVLVNYGNAKGSEIKDLAFEIQKSVFDRFGIELEMEVNIR